MNCTCSCDKGYWAKDKGTVRDPVCLGLPVCHTACTKHISPLSKQHTLPELCFTYAQLHSALEAVVTLRWRHTTWTLCMPQFGTGWRQAGTISILLAPGAAMPPSAFTEMVHSQSHSVT